MIKRLLQGRPSGHPLHVLLVHLPIGLFTLSLVLDVASLVAGDGNGFARASFYALVVGEAAALLAVAPGLADFFDIRRDLPAFKTATAHLSLNTVMVALYGLSIYFRWGGLDAARVGTGPLILSIAAFVVLSISGYLGGKLVYEDGIGTGRHRRNVETPREIRRVRRLATTTTADGFVPVCEALAKQETIVINLEGTIITLARVEEEHVAFQEYCTHRFGPLSEGCYLDGQVTCPWHRSRFDLRSGAVTEGPAKAPLKTYEVRVREGTVYVGPAKSLSDAPAPDGG